MGPSSENQRPDLGGIETTFPSVSKITSTGENQRPDLGGIETCSWDVSSPKVMSL